MIRGGQAVIQAQLQALESKDRARILSAPKLVTLDNITARITRSQNIYVQVDTVSPAGGYGGVGLQEIQTGLTLEITPSIVPAQSDRDQSLVRLNLRAENSAPGSGSFGQIDVNSQEVQTNVLVPDSDTFVIGGLFDDSNINSDSGVPYLKDIPILGALFRDSEEPEIAGRNHLLHHPPDRGRTLRPAERHRRQGRLRRIYPPRPRRTERRWAPGRQSRDRP